MDFLDRYFAFTRNIARYCDAKIDFGI